MAKNNAKVTDNPKLKQKKLSDGNFSLYLEYYLGRNTVYDPKTGSRKTKLCYKKECLKLYLWGSPKTQKEREENRNTLLVAQKIRQLKAVELLEKGKGYKFQKDINFLEYYKQYIADYKKQDVRNITLAYTRFLDFLSSSTKYCQYAEYILPQQITKDMMIDFAEYLKGRSTGTGAHTIFARFKKVIKYATEHDVFIKNPCDGVVIKVDEEALVKDVLTTEEIQRLMEAHYEGENPIVKRAFIFCLYTGLRWCDVKDLTYNNVDYSRKHLIFEQHKTRGHSKNSRVDNPLTDDLIELIGKPQNGSNRNELIFHLPSNVTCYNQLKKWVEAAAIDKHITWHCARHSFAVNILNNNANIKTVASLLGHSGLKHTEKYTRAVDRLKEEAVNSLPKLKF